MPYGKRKYTSFKRKTTRRVPYKSYKKTYRTFRRSKFRLRKYKRYFRRGVNSIAEKKVVKMEAAALPDMNDTFAHSLSTSGTSTAAAGLFRTLTSLLTTGADASERIGNRVFIRHINIFGRVYCTIGADAANSYGACCKASLVLIKELRADAWGQYLVRSRNMIYSATGLDPKYTYLVQPDTGFKEAYVKRKTLFYPMYNGRSNTPVGNQLMTLHFKKRIKVMKELQWGNQETDWSIGGKKLDIYPMVVFDRNYWNLENNGPHVEFVAYVRYTDV